MIQSINILESVSESEPHRRPKQQPIESLVTGIKNTIQKKRKEAADQAQQTLIGNKDKKQPAQINAQVAASKATDPSKKQGNKLDQLDTEDQTTVKQEYEENDHIELKEGMKQITLLPQSHPVFYFTTETDLIQHDDYYDLLKQAKHELMQDELAVANKIQPQVTEKMLRKPKKSNYTTVSVSLNLGFYNCLARL